MLQRSPCLWLLIKNRKNAKHKVTEQVLTRGTQKENGIPLMMVVVRNGWQGRRGRGERVVVGKAQGTSCS